MDDFRVPLYYRCKSGLSPEELSQVQHAIRITPICCVIVTDPRDTPTAMSLGQDIVWSVPESAEKLARSLNQPCVLITGNSVFQSIYEDACQENTNTAV